MKAKYLRAVSGNHALLKHNEMPIIRCITSKKEYIL